MSKPFNENLKQILSDKRMTQADLVKLTGLSKGTISQYCSGAIKPNSANVTKISKALNVDTNVLLGTVNSIFIGRVARANVNLEQRAKMVKRCTDMLYLLSDEQLEDMLLYIQFRASINKRSEDVVEQTTCNE